MIEHNPEHENALACVVDVATAAKKAHYSKGWVRQLCESGKVLAEKRHGTWFIFLPSVLEYAAMK